MAQDKPPRPMLSRRRHRRWSSFGLWLYSWGSGLLALGFLWGILGCFYVRGKSPQVRRAQRGFSTRMRPVGPVVLVHGPASGDILAALPLLRELRRQIPHLSILLTTLDSVKVQKSLKHRLPPGTIYCQAPLDHPLWARRFIKHWRPDLCFFTGGAYAPCFVEECRRRGISSLLINGNYSDRVWRNLSWLAPLGIVGHFLNSYRLCLCRNAHAAERFRRWGHCVGARALGDFKAAAPSPPYSPRVHAQFQERLGDRLCWLACNSTPQDERAVVRAHLLALRSFPNLLLVLILRNPEKVRTTLAILKAHKLSYARRSREETPGANTQVFIVDSLGETGLFYRLARVGFNGGSLNVNGVMAHSLWEAAQLGVVSLHGPNTYGNQEEIADLVRCGGCFLTESIEDMSVQLVRLLRDPRRLARCSQAARAYVREQARACARIHAQIAPYLEPLFAAARSYPLLGDTAHSAPLLGDTARSNPPLENTARSNPPLGDTARSDSPLGKGDASSLPLPHTASLTKVAAPRPLAAKPKSLPLVELLRKSSSARKSPPTPPL